MKVLLCTPYLRELGYASGGINIWGRNILEYYNYLSPDIVLDAVSFDRRLTKQDNCPFFQRVISGVKDYYRSIKETVRAIDNQGPYDILHLCTSAQLGLVKDIVMLRIAHKRGIRTVLHLHFGRVPDLYKKKNIEWRILRMALRLSDAVICMDSKTYNVLQDCGFDHSFCLPNPLSLSTIHLIGNLKNRIKRKRRRIAFVGHVIPSKGVYELVKTCCSIDNIELLLVGSVSNDIRDSLLAIASSHHKGEWLVFRGEVSHDEVISEILSCDVFVLPSYTEGFPNVILEAMACECPIIATSVGAIPEMLNNLEKNQCGLIIPVKNEIALREALIKMLNDDQFRGLCVNNARERVYKHYAIPVVWEQLMGVWKRVSCE